MKKILFMLVVVLCALLFVSCSPEGGSRSSSIEYSSLAGTWKRADRENGVKIIFERAKHEATFQSWREDTDEYVAQGTYEVKIDGTVVEFTKDGTSYRYTCTATDSTISFVLCNGSSNIGEIQGGETFQKQ